MSKAFDSLHHALMIKKLEAYGFNHVSLELMRSYFEDRKNRVKVNGAVGSWKEQLRDCPQGSSFGPLLWNLFQNDLCHHVETDNLFMYADDQQMYFNGKNIKPVASALKKEAENGTRQTFYRQTPRNTRS